MKIVIVAPQSDRKIVGGAENLYISLRDFYNTKTSHSCEIVSLKSPEGNLEEIVGSYKRFAELNLDHFDLVISLKYPTWMVSHRNHVCYMQHTLRGLYDTYHLFDSRRSFDWEAEGLGDLKAWMDHALQTTSTNNKELEPFFRELEQIAQKGSEALLTFPGPFAREVVHFLDAYALSPVRIKKYFSQSHTVAEREDYFPRDVDVSVLYPAPLNSGFYCDDYDFVFTASRLDGPKRIDLIIESFKSVTHNISLLIAGDGPERKSLERLASGDDRIKFLGKIDDRELLSNYANALTVVFVPYDEDYGYVTIEAMKSSKSVITTVDSGGPNEFVVDGQNGFCVQPRAKKIAEKINYLYEHPDVARQMGLRAREAVQSIEWDHAAQELLSTTPALKDSSNNPSLKQPKSKMVVVATFPVDPPRGGGQVRVFNLYRHLAKYYDIEIVCLCHPGLTQRSCIIAPGLTETRIPFSYEFSALDQDLGNGLNGIPISDITAIEGFRLVEAFTVALADAANGADIVVTSHPFLINAIREATTTASIWYESQDVEYDLKRQLLPDNAASRKLLETVFEAEKDSWIHSDLVFACTGEDLAKLEELYGPTQADKTVVTNGVDSTGSIVINEKQKYLLKKSIGIESRNTALFMGSWHGPNLQAAEQVFQLADEFPSVYFFLVGSAGLAFRDRKVPTNVVIFGELDDEEKRIVMCASDVAINPMLSGSGSNLKMLDYFSFGIPVISTPFGARGLDLEPGVHYISAAIEEFPGEMCTFFALRDRYQKMTLAGKELATNSYSWDSLAESFYQSLPVSEPQVTGQTRVVTHPASTI